VTTLLIDLASHEPFDLAFDAPRFVLWRRGRDVRMRLDERHVAQVRRALALRGVRTTVADGDLPARPSLVRAVGTALSPARLQTEDLDVLEVRVVPLGEATARCLRRPIRSWPLGARRRSRCTALLRGADLLLEVRRTAWCGRGTLHANRQALRPVLFDVSATPRPLRVYASDRSLTRWIEG
jgi:hypothetical protein